VTKETSAGQNLLTCADTKKQARNYLTLLQRDNFVKQTGRDKRSPKEGGKTSSRMALVRAETEKEEKRSCRGRYLRSGY